MDKPLHIGLLLNDGSGAMFEAEKTEALKRKTWSRASHVISTTTDIQRVIIEQAPAARKRISAVPNYVDTDNFKPIPGSKH